MDDDEIFATIKAEAMTILDVDAALVTMDAKLNETLDADSVDLIEIAGVLEQRYGVVLEDHELHDLVTVADFVALVRRKE